MNASPATSAQHTINIVLANKPGMLVRVALVFSKRSFNIDGLSVAPKHNDRLSLMTISCNGCIHRLKEITKVLTRLVDVLDVKICDDEDLHHQELMFVKLKANGKSSNLKLKELIRDNAIKAIKTDDDSLLLQMTDESTNVDRFLEKMNHYGIVETVRSGRVSINKKLVV